MHRPCGGAPELSQHRCHHRRRQEARRRRGASGLRLPVGERRLRARLRRGRPRLHRPLARGHRRHGQQGRGQAAHARGRRAVRAGLPGRRPVRRRAGARGRPHRLSRHGQGRGRRRRTRHAPGCRKEGPGGGAGHRTTRGGERLRLGRADPGEGRERCPPRRDPGARRCARPCHAPRRARLLGATPPPESAGGGALARRRCRAARGAWGQPPSPPPRLSATATPARWSSCSVPTARSTSWR